jgi:polyisoprenoid-binding protein YceI
MPIRRSRPPFPVPHALALAGALLALSVPIQADAPSWSVDPAHTRVNFSVNHFFTPVTGSFEDFDVELVYDAERPEKSRVKARIKTASVNTGNRMRDDHLRSADWFEAEKYPEITFESTAVRARGNQLVALGTLSIKGKTKRVELPITVLGSQPIPGEMQAMLGGAKEVASFQAKTSLARADFGVGVGNWASSAIVGGDVGIEILLEAHRR